MWPQELDLTVLTWQMPWSLVTAPDERERCCVVVDSARCEQPSAWIVRGAGGESDDYTCVCGDHVELVRRPGDAVERL